MGDFIEHSYELEVLFVPDTNVECVSYSTKQVKDSGIFPIIVGGGYGGGGVIAFGKFEGGSELICLC